MCVRELRLCGFGGGMLGRLEGGWGRIDGVVYGVFGDRIL